MIKVDAELLRKMGEAQEQRFALDLTAALGKRYPHMLPRFPDAIRHRIVANMLARARSWGITWQSALVRYAELMLAVAPDFDRHPRVKAVLNGRLVDEAVLTIGRRVAADAWALAEAEASDIALFTGPEMDGHSLQDRTAAALVSVVWELHTAGAPEARAAAAIRAADELGIGTVSDAPLAVAAGEFLFGPRFWADGRYGWAADIFQRGASPREATAMLKFRIALDHGRFV